MSDNIGVSIGVAVKRSGVSADLIRVWERRYAAITPVRTGSGRRLYAEDDLIRIALLKQATATGFRIREAARLSNTELRRLVSDRLQRDARSTGPRQASDVKDAQGQIERCVAATRAMDAGRLGDLLRMTSAAMPPDEFTAHVLVPYLHEVGRLWRVGELSVAQEHLGSAAVRSLLGSRYSCLSADESAPLAVGCTLAGELHELGALMAMISVAANGWRTIYLGANCPAAEVAAVAKTSAARAIAVSLVTTTHSLQVAEQLRQLCHLVGPETLLIVGGQAVPHYREVIDQIGAVQIDHAEKLGDFLTTDDGDGDEPTAEAH